MEKIDFGPNPFITDIKKITTNNTTYRTALWTGHHLQLTVMSIAVGDDIGLEVHPDVDQFIRIEEGQGFVQMGREKEHLQLKQLVYDDFAIFVPVGMWHNITNIGDKPLKLYTVYAPPNHHWGTVELTKADEKEE